jgi:hypothetical protein
MENINTPLPSPLNSSFCLSPEPSVSPMPTTLGDSSSLPTPPHTNLSSSGDDAQAQGNRRLNLATGAASPSPHPNSVLYQAPGSLLKGATDDEGNLKPAALMLGIKLDLEAEVHLTARVRGDITIGLY